jgi:Asp-tRNA(Asn)/Glu-tRNA(Gln) amidotransferase A subunit family amidase
MMNWSKGRHQSTPAAIDLTLDAVRRGFETQSFTASDLVRVQLERIREVNDHVKAVAEIDPTAVRQAETLDLERANGHIRGYDIIFY